MDKDIKGILVTILVAGIVYLVYKKIGKPDSRLVVTKYLDATFGGDHKNAIDTFEQGFIDSWSEAIMNGQDTFVYNGKTYITKGGNAKQ